MIRRYLLPAVIVLGICCAGTLLGQQPDIDQPDETLPGFKSQQVYDMSATDSVNLFSGDVHVTVPLGPEYPLSSGLTWRLAAHYSSKLWHMFQYDTGVQSLDCPGTEIYATRAQVGGLPTIGAGWTLELGSYRPHPPLPGDTVDYYKSPDGAHHTFSYLDADADFRDDPQADGSYIVRQSDGTALHFAHLYTLPTPANGFDFSDENRDTRIPNQPNRYGLSSIVDRFGNTVLTVTYVTNCSAAPCPADAWKVQSVQLANRAQAINFHWGTYTGTTYPVVNSIDFPIENGGTLTAIFAFQANGTVNRSNFDSGAPPSGGFNIPTGPSQTNLPFLASITQASKIYSFGYDLTTYAGVLTSVTLPTGGQFLYGYGPYTAVEPKICGGCSGCNHCVPETDAGTLCTLAPSGPVSPQTVDRCSFGGLKQVFIDSSPAVTSRAEQDLAGGVPLSTTTYERDQFGSADSPSSNGPLSYDRIVRRVIVKRPDGNGNTIATKYIFTATPFESSGSELSRRYYADCNTGGTPVRSVVQCFPLAPNYNTNSCGVMQNNQSWIASFVDIGSVKPSRQETWYGANPIPDQATDSTNGCSNSTTTVPCWQDDFAGYNARAAAEYTSVARTANNAALYTLSRTRTTSWLCPATGTPPSYCDPHGSGIWLPKLYSSKTVQDAPCVNPPCPGVTTNYSFDTTNGFLNSNYVADGTYGTLTRTLGPDQSPGDPLTESLGGSWNSQATFTNTRTFQFGLITSSIVTAPAGIAWKSFDVDRDSNTDRITTSRDPNHLPTGYGYDSLSRLISVTPPGGELATTYCYNLISGGSAYNYVLAKKDGTSSCDHTSSPGWGSGTLEAYQYDGFGRVTREVRRLGSQSGLSPGSSLATRLTSFNVADQTAFVSEWTTCSNSADVTSCFTTPASSGTSYSNFDFLGRARLITAADGTYRIKSFDDTLASPAILNSDFTEFMSLSNVNGQSVVWGSRKDFLGRALLVDDPTNGTIPTNGTAPPLGTLTSYTYNAQDKLSTVNINGTQPRSFTYDSFGFLRSETSPETGATTYSSYDARGKLLTWTPANGKSYAASYEPAGRQAALTVNTIPYQQSVYDNTSAGTYYQGRLASRTGYNPDASAAYSVVENFTYSDPTGRLSQKTTSVNSSPALNVTERWLYNPLGLVQNYFHPRAAGAASPFVVSTGYVSGQAVLVTANGIPVVTSASYLPYGGLGSYSTGDFTGADVTTTIAPDAHLMPRPAQISTSNATQNFSTGGFSYDGAGNVLAMGNDSFGYDALSRLTSTSFSGVGSQAYGYDIYGNLLTRSGPNPLSLTVNASTNQISGYSYDALGNLTNPQGETITYDPLSRATTANPGAGVLWTYFYGADGERVVKSSNQAGNTFTLRDLDNRLATEFTATPAASRDNVFLGGLLVGSYADVTVSGNGPNAWVYYSSDHLGTPRLLTDIAGITLETRRNWPFGEDVTTPSTAQRLRFATMERDTEGLRYNDHARSHSFGLARFMNPDKLGGKIGDPQSWNRYAYARNNPLKYVDPNGQEVRVAGNAVQRQAAFSGLQSLLKDPGARAALSYASSGRVSISGFTPKEFGDRFGGAAAGLAGLIRTSHQTTVQADSSSEVVRAGGAKTESPDANTSVVRFNPNQFPTVDGGVTQTLDTALAHELLGHATQAAFGISNGAPGSPGTIAPMFSILFGVPGSEGFAVFQENQYRQERGLEERKYYKLPGDYVTP